MSWKTFGFVVGVATIVGVHTVGRVAAYCSPIRSDSYVFSSFGYRMAHGERLYQDMNDAKPPGVFLLNAAVYAAVDRPTRGVLIPVETVFLLLGYLAVFAVGAELYGRGVGLVLAVAGALGVNFFLAADYAVEGFNLAESYMLPLSAGAAWCYLRALRGQRSGVLLLCGGLLGLGFVLKQTVLPLALAVCIHWTGWGLLVERRGRAWLRGGGLVLVGAGLACCPFVAMVTLQGTAAEAWSAVTAQAATRLTRATAWPGQWRDLMGLWVPMAWALMGLVLWVAWWLTARAGRIQPVVDARSGGSQAGPPGPRAVSFLLLWLALECLLLVYLPQRAFHYYALACLPVVFLSGLLWSLVGRDRPGGDPRSRRAAVAVVAVWSIVFARPAVDWLVPTAVARYRSYESAVDRDYFESALQWGRLDLG
ncbi:MAG: hypothetical protein GY778_30645 [bacterium]|nr:hypothetical protein [bacterium]